MTVIDWSKSDTGRALQPIRNVVTELSNLVFTSSRQLIWGDYQHFYFLPERSKPRTCRGCIITVKYIVHQKSTLIRFLVLVKGCIRSAQLNYHQSTRSTTTHHQIPPSTLPRRTQKLLKSQNPNIPSVISPLR